eukprot:Gb_12322 [translate_table: standard]
MGVESYMGSLDLLLVKFGLVNNTLNSSSVVAITLFVALLCACIIIGHLLHENRWMNESITALVIGLCSGAIVLLIRKGKSSHILVFSEELFFIYLLPPIIFNAGFQVKKKQFFRNFVIIMLFGAVGTFISFSIISVGAMILLKHFDIGPLDIGDYLAIGSLFSATDSVCTLQILNQDQTPFLYSVVFGEGVVNDATSVVLFNAVHDFDLSHIDFIKALRLLGTFVYLFLTSTLLGVIAGLLSAYIIKSLYFGRHSTDREVAIMALMAYLSYMLAELFNLSGILTVFFCGIVMSHYTWHNVTESSRTTTKHLFATLSFIAETFIFLYVGIDALDIDKWKMIKASAGTSVGVSGVLLGLVFVGRAAFVFPLSFLSNCFKKAPNNKIGFRQQFIIWWAGLMRGAVSMALAYNQFTISGRTRMRDHAIIITSTIIVVLFSTVVFGLITKHLIRLVLFHHSVPAQSIASDPSSPKDLRVPLIENCEENDIDSHVVSRVGSLQCLFHAPTSTIHHLWRRFDDSYMRPMFGGRGFVPPEDGSSHEST